MRLATIRIRNKKTGDIRKINEYEWAGDLGVSKFRDWERYGGETQGTETASEAAVMQAEAETQHEKKNPTETVTLSSGNAEGLPPKAAQRAVSPGTGASRGRRGGHRK